MGRLTRGAALNRMMQLFAPYWPYTRAEWGYLALIGIVAWSPFALLVLWELA